MSKKAFTTVKFLGKGSYGSVSAVRRIADGKMYAMKEINIKAMNQREREDAMNEIRILASIVHPNVIRYREAFIENDKLYIITEYADESDLLAKIKVARSSRRFFTEDVIWIYVIQICRALGFLHEMNVLHRDIKTANVFLCTGRVVKLGDLGVAKLLHRKDELARTSIGTPYYISPEIWAHKPYNAKSDVWSLGVVLYELCTLKRPFEANSMSALSKMVRAGKYASLPSLYSPALKNMIDWMLTLDPTKRPSIKEIMTHPSYVSKEQSINSSALKNNGLTQLTPKHPVPMFQLKSTIKVPRVLGSGSITSQMKKEVHLPPSSYSDSTATPKQIVPKEEKREEERRPASAAVRKREDVEIKPDSEHELKRNGSEERVGIGLALHPGIGNGIAAGPSSRRSTSASKNTDRDRVPPPSSRYVSHSRLPTSSAQAAPLRRSSSVSSTNSSSSNKRPTSSDRAKRIGLSSAASRERLGINSSSSQNRLVPSSSRDRLSTDEKDTKWSIKPSAVPPIRITSGKENKPEKRRNSRDSDRYSRDEIKPQSLEAPKPKLKEPIEFED
ncbi:putative G2-specific protein kinase nimA [Blattamonas nauphoetae]|uniref:non-specific serine/threonine protein kinase n=1 Tax=Blattamonas nauphoetae TaxID=2049346 RepID=A0ABQ9Y9H0_9EUKA|nr:putative G2-specific protein kinase nimA [Blattamonas nauphoetae]